MMGFLNIFKKTPKEKRQNEDLREILRNRYISFQSLLAENNRVLTLMADMEEKLSGEYLFDRQYIQANARLIADGVSKIIEHLNIISSNKYQQLLSIHDDLRKKIEGALTHRVDIVKSELAIPLEQLSKDMTNIAGGKIANLGEIRNRLALLTPDGFSITAYAFKRFMEHNRLSEKIGERLKTTDTNDLERMNAASNEIQGMIISAEIPPDVKEAIVREVETLKAKSRGAKLAAAVRSSAICEDGESSFAGQYSTFLNVPEDLIMQRYKEVVASLFTPRAIFYYKTRGFFEEDMVMAVGVLGMVDAKVGGVMYSRDPNNPGNDTVIINAAWGLGMSVVDGKESLHSCIVSRISGAVLEKKTGQQNMMVVSSPEGDIHEVAVPGEIRSMTCLTDAQMQELSCQAMTLENHYNKPQDIEWAIDRDDRTYILQSRPLRLLNIEGQERSVPRRVEGRPILIDNGVIACKGIGFGKAYVIKDEEDLKVFPEGAVLVSRSTSTKYVTVMNKASAIIADVGGATGHMASLSREYGVPTILDAEIATRVIKHGQEITVDAVNCTVYEGKVDELLQYAVKKSEPFKETPLFVMFDKTLKLIVPLNLVDPDKENFVPEQCRTLHDITRFAHETAMAEIFKTGKGQAIDTLEDMMSAVAFAEAGEAKRLGEQTSALRAGIPIDAHLLDIDGGIAGNARKVTSADITSVPFSAFLKGMKNMRWPEARPTDVKGFLGMIAHTASMTEEELHKAGGRSYAVVSRNYMNFSIRLGYHFSMVEAYAGENMNDNYIKFFFKGGGAASDRRLRRVRLIKEILKKLGFRVVVKEDVIDAMLTKYKLPTMESTLEVMGKLTAYTKQLDMVMYNDAITDWYIEEFIQQHIKHC